MRSDPYGKLGYMRENPVVFGATSEIICLMSKNASNDFDLVLETDRMPDNPQEMLKNNFYFSGLIAAEMSCSIIKATNKKPYDHYYMVDLTVTNADRRLLHGCNER